MKRLILSVILGALLLIAAPFAFAQETLGYDEPVTGELSDSQTEVAYTLAVTEGEIILIEMVRTADSDLFSTALIVRDETGDPLINTTEESSSEQLAVAFRAESSGDYTVVATRPSFSSATGAFSLRALTLPPLEVGATIEDTISNETGNRYYALPETGTVGVTYVMTDVDGDFVPSARIQVAFPDRGLRTFLSGVSVINDAEITLKLDLEDDLVYILAIGADSLTYEFNTVDVDFTLAVTGE